VTHRHTVTHRHSDTQTPSYTAKVIIILNARLKAYPFTTLLFCPAFCRSIQAVKILHMLNKAEINKTSHPKGVVSMVLRVPAMPYTVDQAVCHTAHSEKKLSAVFCWTPPQATRP